MFVSILRLAKAVSLQTSNCVEICGELMMQETEVFAGKQWRCLTSQVLGLIQAFSERLMSENLNHSPVLLYTSYHNVNM